MIPLPDYIEAAMHNISVVAARDVCTIDGRKRVDFLRMVVDECSVVWGHRWDPDDVVGEGLLGEKWAVAKVIYKELRGISDIVEGFDRIDRGPVNSSIREGIATIPARV